MFELRLMYDCSFYIFRTNFFRLFFFFVAAVFEDNLDILNLFKDYVGLVTVTVYDSESKFGVLSSGLSRFCFIQ